ncbi:nicotinamide-nucleotide amidohydrolase family protein [Chryseobacterium sp. JJR-5R]|uniref:CinA family protein n=1 Tax=Chryseobacterium sp. JJR-5R TaxID=3093923 RepID=UPI002A748375|nr:nicotinamide-nucleotide amidohydrolase family protein [Chryseobacterium sp. JJR-5R]WPO81564.1 nicotinamide-nucleotide amidohydrolase family protein [Chryseobacterium sp. JJR-5R]
MILKSSKIDLTIEQLNVKSFIYFLAELQNLLEYIGQQLVEIDETVSIAENVTAGFLQFSFSQIKDASKFFKGGITVYTPEDDVSLFGVDPEKVLFCDSVSPVVAEEMALSVGKKFKSDWSVAVTGYACPVEESRHKLYAFFSISHHGKIILSEKLDLHSRTIPVKAQLYYSEFILGCFKLELDKVRADQKIV